MGKYLEDNLLRRTDQICGYSKVPTILKVVWLRNSEEDGAIKARDKIRGIGTHSYFSSSSS